MDETTRADGTTRGDRRGEPTAPTQATRAVTIRDFLIFQLKLVLDGMKDLVVFQLSIGAVLLDLLAARGSRRRLFYRLMEWSERFDLWLNLHGAAQGSADTSDGLFGASAAGSATLLGKLELWARGGDAPRREGDGGRAGGVDTEARRRPAA